MRINTRLNRIELTKRERETLVNAMSLLKLIGKHGSENQAEQSETAAAAMDEVFAELQKDLETVEA